MSKQERILPSEVNLDLSPLYLDKNVARFIRNLDYTGFRGEKEGENEGVIRRLPLVDLYDTTFSLPSTEGYSTIGRILTPENNELYVFNHHDAGKHCIYRVRNGRCDLVFAGQELEFTLSPEYFLGTGRVAIFQFTRGEQQLTFLIFTDSLARQHFLCVEDSIATNSFHSDTFPRFRGSYDRRELISLGVISPTDCIGVTPVTTTNPLAENRMRKTFWQWRLHYTDVYGRASEHGVISDGYYTTDCAGAQAGCVDLSFDAGNPLTQQIAIEYRRNCLGEWSKHETITLRTDCDKPWYEQPFSPAINYNAETNKITYRFCADKGCVAVPDTETDRAENPLPRTSESACQMAGLVALSGNTYGFKPFSCDLLGKIHFSIEKPSASVERLIATRTIKVWGFIYSVHNKEQRIQCIWNFDGTNVFGGLNGEDIEPSVGSAYGQRFSEADQEGWIGSLRGTNYTAISKQYRLSGLDEVEQERARDLAGGITTGEWVESGTATSLVDASTYVYMQCWEFKNVPPGEYIFDVASHRAELAGDYKSTSTYYVRNRPMDGKMPSRNNSVPGRELYINVCEKDYDTMDGGLAVEIWDLTHGANRLKTGWRLLGGAIGVLVLGGFPERRARVSDGYVKEANDRLPIVGAMVEMDVSGDSDDHQVNETDHNGFYFTTAKDRKHEIEISIMRKCRKTGMGTQVWERRDAVGRKGKNFYATDLWRDFEREPCNRIRLAGRVVNCTTGAGLQGVIVVLERGQVTVTDKNGNYEIFNYDQPWDSSIKRLFFYSGGCRVVTCDGGACFPSVLVPNTPCADCSDRLIHIEDIKLKEAGASERGLPFGGAFQMAVKGGDWMDRKNFAQTQESYYLKLPTFAEIGTFSYPKVKWAIDTSAVFPPWMKTLYFNISQNLAFSDFLTWVVDRLEFVDNTGNINNIAPTQIRIYYSSLNEYNKQNNFSTNATWQFIDENDSLRLNDKVEFWANGDGKPFPTYISEPVRFDKNGRYFHVDFNPDLKDLKEGAYLRLVRPQECRSADVFSEICGTIPIVNGKPAVYEGYIGATESYFVNRQIPTPVVIKKKVRKTTTDSAGTVTVTEVEEETELNTIRSYGWPFEHHSPSDFWGTKCTNRGRVSVKNDLEDVIIKGDEIALSGALGVNSLANYLHYFEESRKKSFGRQYDILSCIAEGNTLLAVCAADHLVTQYDENSIRLDEATGRAIVVSADKQFGRPRPKQGDNYGCRRVDRNTIAYHNGLVHWIDGNNIAEVIHDFKAVKEVSFGRFKSFLRRKIKSIDRNNVGGWVAKRYLHAHINPKDVQCYISDFDLTSKTYIVDADSPQGESSETYCIDLRSGALRKFCSFVPEWYASLAGDDNEEQFVLFKGGLPYKMYRPSNTLVNNFFGVQCSDYIRFPFTIDPMAVQQPMSIEVYSDNVVLYSPEVKSGFKQLSRIPRNWFKRGDKYYVAPFLCDTENNSLFSGERLRGRYIEVLLQSDPDKRGVYNELTGIKINSIQP